MQPRRIARELALLSLSQLPAKAEPPSDQMLSELLLAATRTLAAEARDHLEAASAELKQSSDRLLLSTLGSADLESSRAMLQEVIEMAQAAINRTGNALDLPEWVQLTDREEVRKFGGRLVLQVSNNRERIDRTLNDVMVDWQLHRVPRLDQDILRLAAAEILFLGTPEQVAINEAVELANRYSDEEGRRFINGVLRRLSTMLGKAARAARPSS
ncbi:transcription antitermination factor NusB [Synechococcus elongatus]|uniref:Transcription antitermination protein NusB n=2 Tax=Synechococcus elongatus TaxID=32046 RepID=NUSB_SYNE7|nr:transcription antitermination factor NusB [Synechococcus elongatus]Q5N1J7.1 RecName: Full=Transcription antitermination protein NusB; AltName: Full=Antitermination factor NusB [Synechococcus elongatus PCC 6301]Q8GIR7.1 RecName: Full=Transcription antitermination protein NusB; AltName: Full=Antitermination factor NusB [Synechococcus elongatus PCC 7942 = FACHB-805]AAN71793.1 unknown [Synechococcus elongatus PCC 7942 = FACHB-805]ABB58501.1 transcription antitermination factor NusB [Synechococcu